MGKSEGGRITIRGSKYRNRGSVDALSSHNGGLFVSTTIYLIYYIFLSFRFNKLFCVCGFAAKVIRLICVNIDLLFGMEFL